MARKRMSSINEIREMPAGGPPDAGPDHMHLSASVRKIDNGYVSTHTREHGEKYEHTERYHATKPDVEELLGQKREEPKPVNHLKGAISAMRGGKV